MALDFDRDEFIEFVIRQLDDAGLDYMLAGSWASSVYGEPRLTLDVDVVIDLSFDQVQRLCQLFPDDQGFFVSADAAREAVRTRHQFNVLHPASGNKIDFILSGNDPWGRTQIKRRRRISITPELEGFACGPEDVIIAKLIYYREGGSEKHITDIAKMLGRSGHLLDRVYLEKWTRRLGLTDVWENILTRFGDS